MDKAGNLYGTTVYGYGAGSVWKVAPDGTETVIYSFHGGSDGGMPHGGLIRRGDAFFGTTQYGGTYNQGTVFKIKNGTESVLYNLTGEADGGVPYAGLISDGAGYLYGTTTEGGAYWSGAVFKISVK